MTAIEESIIGTRWVAEQNGVVIDDAKIKQKIREYVERETKEEVEKFIALNHKMMKTKNLEKEMAKVMENLVQYYIDPRKETELTLMESMEYVEGDSRRHLFLGFMRIMESLSVGLALALDRKHDKRNETQPSPMEITPAPAAAP